MNKIAALLALLALSACAREAPDQALCEPGVGPVRVSIENTQFDTDCLAASAGEPFTIELDNLDNDQHNVAIYTSEGGDLLFRGDIFMGPESVTYDVPELSAGEYYFQCDVHPETNGTFVVL